MPSDRVRGQQCYWPGVRPNVLVPSGTRDMVCTVDKNASRAVNFLVRIKIMGFKHLTYSLFTRRGQM